MTDQAADKAESAAKAAEVMQAGITPENPGQLEAFPTKEQHISEAVDKAIADVEAELAEAPAETTETTPEKPIEAPEATPKAKKAVKAAKEPETEPVETPETPAEPQLTARERIAADFKATAAKEADGRAERQELKEWKAKVDANQTELAQLRAYKERAETDPLGHFETLPADTYEKLTHQYAKGEKTTPERSQLSALEKKIEVLTNKIEQNSEATKTAQNVNWISNHMLQADQILATHPEEFKPIREYHAAVKKLTGEDTNVHIGISKIYDDMLGMSDGKRKLTPRECLEIMLEDSEERLAKNRPETPEEKKEPEPKPARKPAKTLTNADETESVPAGETDEWAGSRDAHLDRVARNVDSSLWNQETK